MSHVPLHLSAAQIDATLERMGDLFERFIRGFLKTEFSSQGRVAQPKFRWTAGDDSELLPELRTDLVIEAGEGRVCVGECKLYKSPLVGSDRGGKSRLRRDHLFQLFAYLSGAAERYPGATITGLLIYGRVGDAFDVDVRLRDFPVRVRTLGLDQPWPTLRSELVSLWPRIDN